MLIVNKIVKIKYCGVLLLSLLSASVFAADDRDANIAQLHVRGEAQLMVAPDRVSITAGVTTQAKHSKQAIAENAKKMNAIIKALQAAGLNKKSYKTQNFQVHPVWTQRPRSADKSWKSAIASYRVSNSLKITTKKIERAGDIIDALSSAGANQIHSVIFDLANPREYRSQAIKQAMENAQQDAQALAAASGDTISRTLTLRLDNTSASVTQAKAQMRSRSSMLEMSATAEPSPISAGDISVRAVVSVTYQLAD